MVILTGSKQSGTSVWMQILIAAGYPPFGEEIPAQLSEGHPGARREGSFEASLRHGIYFATNPHPMTGQYVFPEQLARHVGEIFPFGVTRTDRAYIGKVVATLRPFREYVASAQRLYALEDAGSPGTGRARLDPSLEWWAENYALVRDASIRQYPVRFETLGRLLRDPERAIREVVGWLGSGDASRAADTVKPEHRQFEAAQDVSVGPEIAAVCDDLYGELDAGRPISPSLSSKLNEAHGMLLPRLREEDARLSTAAR